MKPFHDPEDSIGNLDAATAATLVATSADVALVLDRDGVIQDMSVQASDLSLELEGYRPLAWPGPGATRSLPTASARSRPC